MRFNYFVHNALTPKAISNNSLALYRDMTACIACLADNGKGVVLAADNKTTHLLGGNAEWEEESKTHKKILRFSDNIFVMCAGDNYAKDIVIGSNIADSDSIEAVTEKIQKSLFEFTKKLRLTLILIPNGFSSWDDYFDKQTRLNPYLSGDICNRLTNCLPNCIFIVVVFNRKSQEAGICTIPATGTIQNNNEGGYAGIGSGDNLAKFSLLKSKYDKSRPLKEVEAMVREAMDDASHAAGVGKLGELIVLPESK